MVHGSKKRIQQTQKEGVVTLLDAAHLTNNATKGIMQATVKHGANREVHLQTLSICAGNESKDSWKYHLNTEKDVLGDRGNQETFVSDRKSGLEGVIESVYPTVTIGACSKHLQDNLSSGKNKITSKGLKSRII